MHARMGTVYWSEVNAPLFLPLCFVLIPLNEYGVAPKVVYVADTGCTRGHELHELMHPGKPLLGVIGNFPIHLMAFVGFGPAGLYSRRSFL